MKSAGALLLNLSGSTTLSSKLQKILETAFTITLSPQFSGIDEELAQTIRRADPGLIFLISIPETLAATREALAALKRVAPDVPVIVALEECDSDLPQQQFRQLIGQSPVFLQQVQKISLIASCEANVLIVGETGTGKELYARAIHYGSARAGRPFMPVNCGAIPAELVENELFGHVRGAFTSASSLQVGLIEEANGGTLFLDEIDCLPVHAQVKLLRFLQEKEYRPLGSSHMRRADVRVVAASNLNLEEAVDTGKVRQDLFYRLNIISLTLPPLRDRREDIPLLARHFLAKYSREFDSPVRDFSDEAMDMLMVYSWPGNVRELEHAVERAIVMCNKPLIQASDIVLSNQKVTGKRESLREAKAKEIERFEKNYIQGVLSACRGNITRAAQISQKNRRAFWQLIQKYRIDVSRFKPAS
jgi:DNA-binding NtrC family response regulator